MKILALTILFILLFFRIKGTPSALSKTLWRNKMLKTKNKNKETFDNRFSVVNPYGMCHTVVAHIAMDGHYYIYPTLNPTVDNVRSITIREAARLQSFPDDYFFEGSRSAAFMQIGNAVPVMMSYHIAEALRPQLEDE